MVDANIFASFRCFYCEWLPDLQRAIYWRNSSFWFSMQVSLWTHWMQRSYKKKKYSYLENLISKKENKNFNDKVPKDVGQDQSEHLLNFASQRRQRHFCSTTPEPHQTQWKCEVCEVSLCFSGNQKYFSAFHE